MIINHKKRQQVHKYNLEHLSISKHTNINLLVLFIFNVGRTLPHSILTIFLMHKGISIANVALFQICFMLPIFIFEIPSGIWSDKIGRKPIYLISIILLIIGFSLIGFGNFVALIFIGQFFYGLASALMSGTIESDLLLRYKSQHADQTYVEALKRLQVKSQITEYVSMIVGGVTGSFLFTALDTYFYLLPVSLFLITLIISIIFVPLLDFHQEVLPLGRQLKNFLSESKLIIKKKGVFLAIILICISQFLMQPFFNNWQKIYLNKGLNIEYLGLIYGVFQVIGIIASFVFLKVNSNSPILKIILIIAAFTIAAVSLIFLRGVVFIVIFSLFIIPQSLFADSLSLNLSINFSKEHISTQTSVISSVTRLFSVVSLLLNYLLLNLLSIDIATTVSFASFAGLSILIILTNMHTKKGGTLLKKLK